MSVDFSTDQAIFDNLETVTFTSVRTAGNQTASVTDASFYPGATGEASPSYGVYTKGLAKFSIRVSVLSSVSGAKPRDTITRSNGDVYTVISANPGNITQVWQLDTICLALAADLRSTGTLSRPSASQDTSGRAALTSYSTVASGVACRVQPQGGQGADVLDRRTIAKRYTAFLGQQLTARAKDKFVCDGVTYTVVGVTTPERITDLCTLDLEEVL